MTELFHLNLIQLFTFYLAATFLVSTFRRLRQYGDAAQLVMTFSNRWPKLLNLISKHRMMFLTWATLRPAALAIVLLIVQLICSRLIWPTAKITLQELKDEWWMWPFVLAPAIGMVMVDMYFIIVVGKMDRKETEKYLDEAEHWLSSWKAPLVAVVTLGFVNPRQMVDTEVRKALEEGNSLLKQSLWWVSLQTGLRIAFGLSLWISWGMLPD
jgi:hypothetical protein